MRPQSSTRIRKSGPSRLRHAKHKPQTLDARDFETLLRQAARFFENHKPKGTHSHPKKKP